MQRVSVAFQKRTRDLKPSLFLRHSLIRFFERLNFTSSSVQIILTISAKFQDPRREMALIIAGPPKIHSLKAPEPQSQGMAGPRLEFQVSFFEMQLKNGVYPDVYTQHG